MRKSSRLIVVLAAAALTFGSLYAFVGTNHWSKVQHSRYGFYKHECPVEDNSI